MTARARNVTTATIAILLTAAAMLGVYYLGIAVAHGDTTAAHAGSGSAVATAMPAPVAAPAGAAAALPDPLANPQATVDTLHDLKAKGWPFAIWGGLLIGLRLLAALRGKIPALGFLAKGKTAAIIAGAGAVAAAAFNAIAMGGSWMMAAVTAGLALVGLNDPTHPADRAP